VARLPPRTAGDCRDVLIGDYALIGDCHTAALVSRDGAIDWCCLPRFDSGSAFAALLDAGAGSCRVSVEGGGAVGRRYLDGTLVLETLLEGPGGSARLIDCMPFDDPVDPAAEHRMLLRVIEGVRGSLDVRLEVSPRFDYGEVAPWIRHHGRGVYSAIGGDDALVCSCDGGLEADEERTLVASATVRGGERFRVALAFRRPQEIDGDDVAVPAAEELDRALEDTIAAWREWSGRSQPECLDPDGVRRSALVLKALTYKPTGALVAAPTTSLPESLATVATRDEARSRRSLHKTAGRTWDYRYAWIRDAVLATRCLTELGHDEEAAGFRGFIERSAAGSADDLLVCYGVGGERRIGEQTLDELDGFAGIGPVRVGNDASGQLQLDAYGHLVEQSWRWCELGHSPDDDYWRFLLELVDAAAERWREPDRGIWEWRGKPRHFVHSKVMCWVALDRGLRLAERCLRKAPERRWRQARDEVREAVLSDGYDSRRETFRQSFGARDHDAALLRLPSYGFIDYDDPRMLGTVAAIRDALEVDGLVRRYDADDGLPPEGAFLACSFWLAECLAGQNRIEEARAVFERTLAAGNDLGLFPEEADPSEGALLGNFPQALTHLAHVEAALALGER
jgi:GH15 family glucan-1,4-alpha-glucosidase